MSTMAVLAKYGNVQPSEFSDMDFYEAMELARRVTKLHEDDLHFFAELTEGIMKSNAGGG